MSYAAEINERFLQQTGVGVPETITSSSTTTDAWDDLWHEVFRSRQAIDALAQSSSTMAVLLVISALPRVGLVGIGRSSADLLGLLEKLFGESATDLAKMLRVSRPMVYHYREGMEPTVENRRRLLTLSALANECLSVESNSLKEALRTQQPGGRTLFEYLCDKQLDVSALRQMLWRNIQASDQILRGKLADALSQNESAVARSDIKRARHAEGKPVYIGDPDSPGTLIQIRPDGSRVRGRMVKRKFLPDEE